MTYHFANPPITGGYILRNNTVTLQCCIIMVSADNDTHTFHPSFDFFCTNHWGFALNTEVKAYAREHSDGLTVAVGKFAESHNVRCIPTGETFAFINS